MMEQRSRPGVSSFSTRIPTWVCRFMPLVVAVCITAFFRLVQSQ